MPWRSDVTTSTSVDWPTFTSSDDPLDVIVKLSRFYGSDPSIVLAGGGNTSCKVDDVFYVKGSGTALATMTRDGFVKMDRNKLSELAGATLDEDPETREAQYKQWITGARCEPEKGQRPSVEVLLHHLVPGRYVVHSHATIANTLTCLTGGQAMAEDIFGDDVVWVPYVDPGFILAQTLEQALRDYRARTGRRQAKAILMANHGLIVAGDDPQAIRANTNEILGKIAARLRDDWQTRSIGKVTRASDANAIVRTMGPALRALLAEDPAGPLKVVAFDDSDVALGLIGTEAGRAIACAGPMTPDQIVYCNSFPLWFEPKDGEDDDALIPRLRDAIDQHTRETRFPPKVVLVQNVGLFAAGDDFKMANTAREVYLDAIQVMAGATRLGGGSAGVSYLTDRQRRFIEDWELEAYRRKVAAASAGGAGRLQGKVAVVTGAAQGFGREIAQGLAAEGAHVVLADINQEGAAAAAAELAEVHGIGRAISLPINVTDGESVAQCIDQVVRTYGGLDVFISNAGVLKAESVKTQPEKDFEFVTDVNYKGYFLCVQKAAPILATQHKANPASMSDIIQINSKSGLAGSSRNAAYAGSKFGGIGLTQSFALELVDDGIKVNSICPGNFFDGPLWSDPENGLFAQYLRAGKVPGAKTVDDVRRAYEAKVPMGRGCTTADVIRAILYLIEQQYETGQALPVTGGQVMLS
jgi:rhamnose utilization protein RhaD (predicted bifunctional aldolase and dehydrogenase)/NAD(P)-dependent dehydrogenase (short-subunit alcohol dehydrogenase family)